MHKQSIMSIPLSPRKRPSPKSQQVSNRFSSLSSLSLSLPTPLHSPFRTEVVETATSNISSVT